MISSKQLPSKTITMLDILKQILLLPITSVKPDLVRDILDDFSITKKSKEREAEIANMIAVCPNLKIWVDTFKELSDFQKSLNQTWIEFFAKRSPTDQFTDAISNDDLIPTVVALLPDDPNDLTALLTKLKVINQFQLSGFAEFLLTSLESSLVYKIAHLNNPIKFEHADINKFNAFINMLKKLQQEIESKKCRELLATIKKIGNDYKTLLLTELTDYLKEKNPSLYKKYFEDNTKDKDIIILAINEALQEANNDLANDNNAKLIAEKCVALSVMSYQFNHENPSHVNLLSFAQLFVQHETTLRTKPTTVPVATSAFNAALALVRSNRFIDFFKPSNIEEQFLHLASEFSRKIIAEHDEFMQIRQKHILSANQLSLARA